jgi:WD40 repeat protein
MAVRYVASGGADGVAAVWDLNSFSCVRTCTQMDGEVKTLSISHDSQYLAYAGEQEAVFIEALQEGACPLSPRVGHCESCGLSCAISASMPLVGGIRDRFARSLGEALMCV